VRYLLAALVTTSPSACAPELLEDEALDHEAPPRSDLDELMGDAPPNDTLPGEGKEDGSLPIKFDIVATQSPVRDQGGRSVCSIFASMGLVEHLYIKAGKPVPDFSEQYLQWAVKNVVGYNPNTAGSSVGKNGLAMARHGVPAETAWPYDRNDWTAENDPACTGGEHGRPTRCYTNGSPPASAARSPLYRLPEGRYINPTTIRRHLVDTRTAVIVSLPYYETAWYNSTHYYFRKGYIMAPSEAEIAAGPAGGHAIVIVGYDDSLTLPRVNRANEPLVDASGKVIEDTGFYIFKNSWGTSWATQSDIAPGYGLIARAYVDRFGSAYVVGLPTGEPVMPPTKWTRTFSGGGRSLADGTGTGVLDTIDVGHGAQVGQIKVTADVDHPAPDQLVILIEHAGVRKAVAWREATGPHAERVMSQFAGHDRQGAWTLTVVDQVAGQTGKVTRWSIELL
jgi:hypothetical protein